jgi:predicted RNA binding protein YcfA (HicA-like mRNA interferase family)
MERNSRKLMRMLEKDGWALDRVKGDHHIFKHPKAPKVIALMHPRKDLSIGVVRSIYKIAGWKS